MKEHIQPENAATRGDEIRPQNQKESRIAIYVRSQSAMFISFDFFCRHASMQAETAEVIKLL